MVTVPGVPYTVDVEEVIVGLFNTYLNTDALAFRELTVTDTSNGLLISVTTTLDGKVQVICLSVDAVGVVHGVPPIVTDNPKL